MNITDMPECGHDHTTTGTTYQWETPKGVTILRCTQCKTENDLVYRAGKIKNGKPICGHDLGEPDALFWQYQSRNRRSYLMCRQCKRDRSAKKPIERTVPEIPAYLLADPTPVLNRAIDPTTYLITHHHVETVEQLASQREHEAFRASRAKVIQIINGRGMPADVTADLIHILMGVEAA